MSDDFCTYPYPYESLVDVGGGRPSVLLATSGGAVAGRPTPYPYFFDGFVERAEIVAAAMLMVARVARARFYTPPGTLTAILRSADPVVTSDGRMVRFESFSVCCGVYCRMDLLPEGLDREPLSSGTTNVDFNPPLRDALASVGGLEPLRLSVGSAELRVTTLDTSVVEPQVKLPSRWVKGLGEVQAVMAGMAPQLATTAVALRRFLQAMPRTPQRGVLYAESTAGGLRLASRPSAGTVPVSAVDRLRIIAPLLRYAEAVQVYAPDAAQAGSSAWVADLPGVRFTVTLSPSASRGFSGEGGLLADLADSPAGEAADLVSAVFGYDPAIDLSRLARDTGLAQPTLRRALTHLAAAGRVGFDLGAGSYFHRELPYPQSALPSQHPRLRDARALVDGGQVTLGTAEVLVRSGTTTFTVRATPNGYRCTCTWFGAHGTSRGPCKHALAAQIARRSGAP